MSLGNDPAYPMVSHNNLRGDYAGGDAGMTKREVIAMHMMATVNPDYHSCERTRWQDQAEVALKRTDALLEALSK